IAYVRMFSGTIHIRERLRFGRSLEDKVTAITVFERGPAAQRSSVSAGAVAKLWGLSEIQVGDRIGETGTDASDHQFAPPTLGSIFDCRWIRARFRSTSTRRSKASRSVWISTFAKRCGRASSVGRSQTAS